MSSIPNHIQIGTRIQVGRDRATVKFIGVVDNTKGEWLGIEWDNAQRGKHDGLHRGTRFFTCRYPTSGSFIRYAKDKVLTGTSFLLALQDRYIVEDDITTIKSTEYDPSKDRGELYFGGNKSIVVETVGFEKIQRSQRQLSSLKVVGLAEQLISSAGGNADEIKQAKLEIQDLDLSRNLISNWNTISDIVSQLPSLCILRLNQLRFLSPPTTGLQLSHLTTLALNQTLIDWHDIEILAPQLPQLQDLQLGGNRITSVGQIEGFQQLKCLNLEDNLISDWSQVSHLAQLPNLQVLYLNDNQITSVNDSKIFPKLRFLRIENNQINDWSSVDALNKFPSLTKLRCKGNRIFKDMLLEEQATQLVGRIQNLAIVNGNTLTNRERTDLERFYLKLCIKDGTTHEKIAAIHPRYLQLCQIHGEPDLEVQNTEIKTVLKGRLLNIRLTQRQATNQDIEQIKFEKDLPSLNSTISKKFLPTMNVRNLKNMIARIVKIPAAKQHLYLIQHIKHEETRDLLIMDMNDDLRDLKFYGIQEDDEILIN